MYNLLKATQISYSYTGYRVLRAINLELDPSDIVALIGSNGAGKSSLLGILSGLLHANSGTIYYQGQDITQLDAEQRARLGIVHLTEGRGIFSELTVRENLLVGGWWNHSTEITPVLEMIPELTEILDSTAGRLTSDDQQLCAFGRALMANPAVLLIDELSLGLSPVATDRLLGLLPDIAARGTSIVVVEQDIERVLALVDRAYVIESGKIKMEGTPYSLLTDQNFVDSYLWGS